MKKNTILCASIGVALTLVMGAMPAYSSPHHRHVSQQRVVGKSEVIINSANVAQLCSLKGLGMKRAQAVVAYRTAHGAFRNINDLVNVKGIGTKLLARLIKNNPGRMRLSAG